MLMRFLCFRRDVLFNPGNIMNWSIRKGIFISLREGLSLFDI